MASIIVNTLEGLPLEWPILREADLALFEKARLLLEAESEKDDD